MTHRDSPVVGLLALVLCLAPLAARGAENLPAESPFLPAPGPATKEVAQKHGYELVGVTTTGSQTLVSILHGEDQRSVWIPVGKNVGDITVVSCDAARETVTIRVQGQEMTLALRRAPTAPSADAVAVVPSPQPPPNPAPAPTPGVPTRPLSPREEKEMEARMLVSDLLEIGQQQRKAYEEARRQAAAKAAADAKAIPPSPVGNPTPSPASDSAAAPKADK